MGIHSRVFWIGMTWCAVCLMPIFFLEHVRTFMYSPGSAGPAGSLVIGVVGLLGIICGIALMYASGQRGVFICIGSFVGLVLLYTSRFGTEPLLAHPQSVLTSLGVLSLALGGGVSLLVIGILRESRV